MANKPQNYPHQNFMRRHGIEPNHLPEKLEKAHTYWFEKWASTLHPNGAKNEALEKSSEELRKRIEQWYDEEQEDESDCGCEHTLASKAKAKSHNEILKEFYEKKKTNVTLAELKNAGYNTSFFGFQYCCKDFKLKDKGNKTYEIIKLKK